MSHCHTAQNNARLFDKCPRLMLNDKCTFIFRVNTFPIKTERLGGTYWTACFLHPQFFRPMKEKTINAYWFTFSVLLHVLFVSAEVKWQPSVFNCMNYNVLLLHYLACERSQSFGKGVTFTPVPRCTSILICAISISRTTGQKFPPKRWSKGY